MKISGRGIDPFLANPPRDVAAVLLYGHDQGLIRERAEKLCRLAVEDIQDPFSTTQLDATDIAKDPSLLVDSAGAMPAFGGMRLVRVNLVTGACLDSCRNLLENPPAESLTVLTGADELNTRSALVKLFESADNAAAIGCYPDTAQSLGQVAREIFASHAITTDRETMDWITDHLGADRMASRSEIDKLVLLAGEGGQLDLDAVREALGDGASVATSDIIHAAADGNIRILSQALDRAQAEAIAGERILRAGIGYFHRLFRISAAMDEGRSREDAIKSVRPPVFFSERPKIEGHLRRWNSKRCRRAMERLNTAELQCRQGIDAHVACGQALFSLALAARK